MEITDFITNFRAQFDETEPNEIQPETKFRNLTEWSSLIALSVIAMVDEEYNVSLKADDIRNSTTIFDLYQIVTSKL